MTKDPESVGGILDKLEGAAAEGERVAVGDMADAMGSRSYGPFLMVPALLEISPIGGVPGVPSVLAAIIVLFAVQMALGRKQVWIPDLLKKRSLTSESLRKATEKLRPLARWLDRWFHGRLRALASEPFLRGAALACILLALTVPPLEILPFASTAPMAAIAAFGLAALVRDGVLMILAYVLTALALAIGFGLLAS